MHVALHRSILIPFSKYVTSSFRAAATPTARHQTPKNVNTRHTFAFISKIPALEDTKQRQRSEEGRNRTITFSEVAGNGSPTFSMIMQQQHRGMPQHELSTVLYIGTQIILGKFGVSKVCQDFVRCWSSLHGHDYGVSDHEASSSEPELPTELDKLR